MSDNYYISPQGRCPKKERRKAFKPTYGDLLINGCTYDSSGNQVWNVREVLKIERTVTLKNGRVYGWIVETRDLRTGEISGAQVSMALFKSPTYEGRRDVY